MDKEFKTTFIPKRELSTGNAPVQSATSRKAQSAVNLLAILLLVTAIISVAGVYLYKLRLATMVNAKIESINLAEKAFEPSVILDLKKLDIRLRAATELLDKHVAVVDFFESFGETTLPDIQYSGISINFAEEFPTVSTTGEARSYLVIAQQSDLFEENRFVQNAIFSNFTRTESGRITFGLTFSINPELLIYGRTLKNVDPEEITTDEAVDLNNVIIEDNRNVLPEGTNIDFNTNN